MPSALPIMLCPCLGAQRSPVTTSLLNLDCLPAMQVGVHQTLVESPLTCLDPPADSSPMGGPSQPQPTLAWAPS